MSRGEEFKHIATEQKWDASAQLLVMHRFIAKKGLATELVDWATICADFENTGGDSAWGES